MSLIKPKFTAVKAIFTVLLITMLSQLQLAQGATLSNIQVESDPRTVQTSSATLKLWGETLTAIPSGGYFRITAPNEVSVKSGSLTCNFVDPFTGGVSGCSASGRIITIYLSRALAPSSFEVHITGVLTNPTSTTLTSTFAFNTYLASGVVQDTQTSNILLQATEGDMTARSYLTPTSKVVGASTPIEVRFTPTHNMPAGGKILVTFPKWNPAASSPQEYLQGVISCSSLAILTSTLQCSFSNSVLTVTGAIGSQIDGGREVAFSVTGFKNPMATGATSGFSITVQDAVGGNIDRGTVSVTIDTPATLTSATVTVDDSTSTALRGIVQELNQLRLSFTSPVPLNTGCIIKVTLPTQLSVATVSRAKVSGLFGSQTTITVNPVTADNSFTFTQCTAYTANSLAANIVIDSIKLPNYNKATNTFQVQIRNSANALVATLTSGATFTATPGAFTTLQLAAVTPNILANTGIQVTLLPKHTLDTTTRMTMTYPSTYVLSSTCTITNIQGISDSATCAVSGQTITIANLINMTFTGGSTTQIRFQVNTFTLPTTTTSQTGFSAILYNQDATDSVYYTVDQYVGAVPITINYGLLAATITPSSFIAYETARYTFTVTPQHYVPQYGGIRIVYPEDITIPDYSFSQSQCTGFVNFPSTPTCVIDTASRTITIRNGFRLTGNVAGGTQFTFVIPGIRNPISLLPTSTFRVYTFQASEEYMDGQESGLAITMTQSAYMRSVAITMGSYVNQATTAYTFQITPTVPVTESHYVVIQFPPEIKLPTKEATLDCSSDDTSIFISVKCTFNTAILSNSIKAVIDLRSNLQQINILQTFKITVQGIMNPNSTKPTSDFLIQVTDRQFSMVNRSPTGLTVSTNTPYTLLKSAITANATGAGQGAYYTLAIFPEHDIAIGGGIYIVYPSQVTVPGVITATVTSDYTKSDPVVTYDKSARQVLIRDAFQLKVVGITANDFITIKIDGFRNPLSNSASSSFIVKTFSEEIVSSVSSYYYIDQVTDGLVLNSACDYPCNSCVTGQPSNCTSCYTSGTLNKLQGGTCVASCQTGKFLNTRTNACEDCTYPCLGCTGSATNCSACGYQDYLFLYGGTCRNDCPSGYVTDSDNNLCAKCSSECLTCQYTTKTCTSCNTASTTYPLFYQSTCLKTCPTGVSVQVGSVCQSCDLSCRTCSGATTTCTSCLSHSKYDPVRNTCTSMCQEGTQIYNSAIGVCMQCDSNCATCSGTINTCTSCSSGQVLNTDNICRSQCSATDQTPVNNICKQCELPCSQCKNSVGHCTKCQGDYLLFNTTCVQYCPDKYEANSETGQCILVGLICPSGFTVNEAGDGCIPNEFECPEGYIINLQKTACVPAPGSPVPFPFLFFSIMLSLLVLGSFIKDRFFTKVLTNLIALISLPELLMYFLILAYSGANEIWGAFVLSFIAVIMLLTNNIVFYLMYKRDVLKDDVFVKWQRSFPKTSKYIPIICLCVNFKAVRLFYSGFYGLESCLAQFDDPMSYLFKPLRMMTYFNYIFVYLPIIIADIIIFAQVKWGYQLLVLGIESFLLALLIIALTYFEMKHPEKLVFSGDEQYTRIKPRNYHQDTMVMGGLVDVDESTLIRSKVVDDDYEIFLRKKAFVSILNQVGKNYFNAQEKGIDLGGQIDQVMTKFDESKLKLRRAFSLEEIKEEESWYIPSDDEKDSKKGYTRQPDSDSDEDNKQRRYSYPMTPRTKENVSDPQFRSTLQEIKGAKKDSLMDNVYAEPKAPDRNQEKNRRKTVSRRTQTYLRELLNLEGDDLHGSDLEIVMEDEAEIEVDYAQGLIDNIIDGISESESNVGGKRRAKKKRKNLNTNRKKEIPDFELADIMGDFEIDDLGNFIILRGEKGELLDKKERRVNRRGYLIDRFGNIINKLGQVIFKAVELDSDDEIPAPFGFEKRKKNLLNLGQDGEFKVEGGQEKGIDDDEDLIDKELRAMKKKSRKRRRQLPNGEIVEEEGDDEDVESSVDSLMAESPGKYQLDGSNEDDIIASVTKKKIPVKRGNQRVAMNKKLSSRKNDEFSPSESQRKKAGPLQNMPPKRIKREDTKEIFPSLAIEASEQKKLFKIAEQIGSMANQIAEKQKMNETINSTQPQNQQNSLNQERLERLKQEHFKDILNEGQQKNINQSEKKLPPKGPPGMDKIYGNLGDVVNYEEQLMKEQYKGLRAQSPFSSQITSRMALRPETSTIGGDKRRLRGLESIYLQKFDKKAGLPGNRKQQKAKFRNTLNQFVDDPELLIDDGVDKQRQNEMSLMVADKLDKLQRQYMNNTTTNRLGQTSMGFMPTVGAAVIRKTGSVSGSIFNQDPSLEPVKTGNWVQRDY